MRHITAPEVYTRPLVVFLGGGITNCPDWQNKITKMLTEVNVVLLNPRQKRTIRFDDPVESGKQIRWEFNHLEKADVIILWFPGEGKCMITLFELGTYAAQNKKIIVGVHPKYIRRLDVIKQMENRRPDLKIHSRLADIAKEVKKLVAENEETI